MTLAFRVTLLFATVGCFYSGTLYAQGQNGTSAVEEIAPPASGLLLDLTPATESNRSRNIRLPARDNGRIDRINAMLSRLKHLANEREKKKNAPLVPPAQILPVPSKDRQEWTTKPIAVAVPDEPPIPTDVVPNVGTEPATSPALDEPPVSLTATVDRLSLANTLFAQGKVAMAQSIYEKLLKSRQEPSDWVWIQYQLACCHRIGGRIKEATKTYRIVSSSKAEPYWAGRAQWWLDYLGRAQQLELQREKLEKQLELLKEAAREPKTK